MNAPAQELEFPGADRPLPDAPLRAKREELIARHALAEFAQDVDGVLATFARGARYIMMPFDEVLLDGDEAVRGYFDELHRAFPDMDHELIKFHHAPDAVFLEGRIAGTQAADWRGIPNRGKRMSLDVLTIFHFDGEVLVDETTYYDEATLAKQLA